VPNRLAGETSPYLQQHAGNPVDWYPWGEEALGRARREDLPILLSIGYSACHWCHVMERESFEDPDTAALMNQAFVNIKVDREERPDLDGIYMRAVQILTGRGGWPLTAFLTPEGKAFYGGTYFPPEPRHGMPSFRQVLEAVVDAYRNRREEVERGSGQLLAAMTPDPPPNEARAVAEAASGTEHDPDSWSRRTLDHAFRFLRGRYDPIHGGFGPAPKFPQPTTLGFLLHYHRHTGEAEALEMVLHTLRRMARGGMRDHLDGGFHRYSVDERWLAPHFEKMLYDNGLLARIYLHAFQVTGDPELRDTAVSTLDYVLRDLTAPEGGFYSARDADSEGVEGLFYLWTPDEVDRVLGREAGSLFRKVYDVTEDGNFEGRNILNLRKPVSDVAESAGLDPDELISELARGRAALAEARRLRAPPLRDEKVLTAWNSLVLRALAEAGATLRREDYLEAARRNAAFILEFLVAEGVLLRSWKDGPGRTPAFLEDTAGLGNALLSLYEATLEPRWLHEALSLADSTVARFWDEESGVFFDTAAGGEELIIRPREPLDNATPSGNSLAAELLWRAGRVSDHPGFCDLAKRAVQGEAEGMSRFPSAFGRLLGVLLRQTSPALVEVVLLGTPGSPGMEALLREVHRPYLPHRVVVGGDPASLPYLPLLEGKKPTGGRPTAWVCSGFTCGPPVQEPSALAAALREP